MELKAYRTMIYILTILLILLTLFLVLSGKPIGITYNVNLFLDSFEKTDYNNAGRIKQDYLPWKSSEDIIRINYCVCYKWEKNPFIWKNKISVKLDNIKLPDGFEITLKKDNDDFHEYHSDYEMLLIDRGSYFIVKINQIDNYIDLKQPQLIKFNVNIILGGTSIREIINYEFLIGEELGESWVAFDPGTTATTIAFGNSHDNIIIAKKQKR